MERGGGDSMELEAHTHLHYRIFITYITNTTKATTTNNLYVSTYVTGSGKRDIFAHIFKIELLAPQGRVSSQLSHAPLVSSSK